MKNSIIAIIATVFVTFGTNAQTSSDNKRFYTPYVLNYLPYGAPAWMAELATPQGLDYNAMVDSFNVYLQTTPGARYKSPETKQVVNHFRRFQKAYSCFVQPDGIIRLPLAAEYHKDVADVDREIKHQRAMQTRAAEDDVQGGTKPWRVISPIVTYHYDTKKVSPAQSNIQRMKSSRSNPNVLYCGSETGMIFRSIDKGETWQPCNNGEWMSGEITTVDVSSTNHNRVLIGAGGVFWLSDDGGDVWTNVTPQKATYARTNVAQFCPDNDQIILAGDRAQLWRSVDGGSSWQRMLDGMVFDIKFSNLDKQMCYVAIEQENTVKLYKSMDAGATWNLLTLDEQPLISARIGLSDAPDAENYVYLWACRRNHLSQPGPLYFSGPALLYKSINGGESFEVFDPVEQMETVDKNGGQGYYDLVCTASATDPETILVGIIQLYRSTDGGKTLQNIGGYYGKFDLHCDMQSIHTNGSDTWLSTDGGIIYSDDFFAENAVPKFYGIYASELWGFDQGWNEDVMVGGRNHNGNMSQLDRYNGVTLFMSGSERPTGYVFLSNPRKIAFSDSGNFLLPDDWQEKLPFLDFWTYPKESSQYGIGFEFDSRYAQCFYIVQGYSDEEYKTLWRTYDDGASFSTVYRFEEPITSIAVSRSNPDKIVVFTWGRMYYSLDAGNTFTESVLPQDMTYSINYKIAIHPTNENEIWVSDGNPGGMWRTIDNGQTWKKIDKGLQISNWEDNIENHCVGRFFLTGNEKNAAYAIAYTMGYLNESYTTPRGRVLYCDDTTDGWINYSEGLPKVMNLNRMLPFYKNGVIRLATNNGVWERALVDSCFKPIAQPIILNVGSGDNTKSDYPRTINLDSYSIVNQIDAQWHWDINPAPLTITSADVRNPVITIEPNQSYDITLTVTTPSGSDTKTIEGMIWGDKPVPDVSTNIDDAMEKSRDLLLLPGNTVAVGQDLRFIPQNLAGSVKIKVFDAKGNVVRLERGVNKVNISTIGLNDGLYIYSATDEQGYMKTGKLLLKEE